MPALSALASQRKVVSALAEGSASSNVCGER
jgi:hypothetical protein